MPIPYQSHDGDIKGMSDSQRKAIRLAIPRNLVGQRVLDIGCNEGYFCNLVVERGAANVIGIDYIKQNIDNAKQRYNKDNIEFICQSWDVLPKGPFDLIIWSSAMHYELDPRQVVNKISSCLAKDGLFILECGVIETSRPDFIPWPRIADTRWYPSMQFLLEHILYDYSVRHVAQPEIAEGDFVPRSVFHCKKRLPTVLIINGATMSGKTSFTHLLLSSATKVISLDYLVSRLGVNKFPHGELEELLVKYYDPKNLGKINQEIEKAGLTDDFAKFVVQGVVNTDRLVIIEGDISAKLNDALIRNLSERAFIWNASRENYQLTNLTQAV